MACYSNGCKSMCSKVVIGLSVVILILGLVSTIFGGAQLANKVEAKEFLPEIGGKIDNSGLGTAILIFGLITIATGTLGVLTAKYKKPWFATLFIVLTCLMGLALFLFGILAALGGDIYDAVADSICVTNPGYNYYKELVDQKFCTD